MNNGSGSGNEQGGSDGSQQGGTNGSQQGGNNGGNNSGSQSSDGGPGMGNSPNSGDGGVASEKESEYNEKEIKMRSQLQAGEIIGMYRKRGTPPSGEAQKQLGRIIDHSQQEAQDAMNDQGYSPNERDFVKGYYDNMRKHFGGEVEEEDDDE